MKTRVKVLLPLLLLLTLPVVVEGQFILTTNNGTITIKGYTGSGGAVDIPSTTNGLPVTSIGNNAFAASFRLSSVTNIGSEAFYKCFNLTSATIDTNVASLGDDAFNGCSRLASVSIPASVTSFGNGAFGGCGGLTRITIPSRSIHQAIYVITKSSRLGSANGGIWQPPLGFRFRLVAALVW